MTSQASNQTLPQIRTPAPPGLVTITRQQFYPHCCTTLQHILFRSLFTGFLFDSTGDYTLAFCTAGAAIAISGIICLPLRYIHQCDSTRQSLEQVEKALVIKAEEAQNTNNSYACVTAPTLRTNALIKDARLYSSKSLLATSHSSIGLPNPYISYDDVNSSSDSGEKTSSSSSSCENLKCSRARTGADEEGQVEAPSLCDSALLSQSDSALSRKQSQSSTECI